MSNRNPLSDRSPVPLSGEGSRNSVIPMAVNISVAVLVLLAVVAGLVIVKNMGYSGGATFHAIGTAEM